MDLRLTEENSEAIGFVVASLFSEALNVDEMNKWADSIILETDDYPEYILELCIFNGKLKDIYKVIGFTPVTAITNEQRAALSGIADLRGIQRYESSPTKLEAAKALSKHPEIQRRFLEEFPFITISG